MSQPLPTQLTQLDAATLGMTWTDGHQSCYNVRHLRLACRCALCVDELTGAPKLAPEKISPTVKPVSIQPVGQYAVQIAWSDGHSTGIYRFDYLRRLCECTACTAVDSDSGSVTTRS